jgi:hypothetical protein
VTIPAYAIVHTKIDMILFAQQEAPTAAGTRKELLSPIQFVLSGDNLAHAAEGDQAKSPP